jgi:hypothetical protein
VSLKNPIQILFFTRHHLQTLDSSTLAKNSNFPSAGRIQEIDYDFTNAENVRLGAFSPSPFSPNKNIWLEDDSRLGMLFSL